MWERALASRQIAAGVEFDVYMLPIVPRPILVGKRLLVIDEWKWPGRHLR